MASSSELRQALDAYIDDHGDIGRVIAAHPDCACENADTGRGNQGPVQDGERLRYFVTSTSNVKAKRTGHVSPLGPNVFKRAFQVGLSVVRLDHASPAEIDQTAREQYANQVKNAGDEGGVVGVLDFTALAVRRNAETEERICCVFETPMDEKPSHADVAHNKAIESGAIYGVTAIMFNQVGGLNAFVKSADVSDVNLMPYWPQVLVVADQNRLVAEQTAAAAASTESSVKR